MIKQIIVSVLLFLGLHNNTGYCESLGFDIETSSNNSNNLVVVVDDVTLEPILDAEVVISDLFFEYFTFDDPIAFYGTTNREGKLEFPYFNSAGVKAITVTKDMYIQFTVIAFFNELDNKLTIYLKRILISSPMSVTSGVFKDWDPLPGKKYVQAGLSFRALHALDVLDFQVGTFFSPLT
ncbi:MAG: hypothetical protein HY843_05540, partial [Bdellovibrio sp.]|nr:hypothetical protein [Bdellovibrio sp.]